MCLYSNNYLILTINAGYIPQLIAMSADNTRREFVKNSIAATAALGTIGAVGSASAASSGTIEIQVDGPSWEEPYHLELLFEDNGGMSITTSSGKFESHSWGSDDDGNVVLQGTVAADADIVMEYENTEAWENESETEDEVDITIS